MNHDIIKNISIKIVSVNPRVTHLNPKVTISDSF